MSIKKKSIVTILLVLVLIVSLIIVYAVDENTNISLVGKRLKEIRSKEDKVIVIIDGEEITQNEFDVQSISRELGNANQTDKEILDSLIEKQVVYNEAVRKGITISEDRIDEIIKLNQQSIKQNSEYYKQLRGIIDGLGITEEQYWKDAIPIYNKILVMGEYKNNYLKLKFMEENKNKDITNISEEYKEYYKKHIESLKVEAKIEYKSLK